MLQVGSPKVKVIKEKINNQIFEGIHFLVTSSQGLTINVDHNAESDEKAKSILKKVIASLPETKNAYTNIQYIDKEGHIL